jgi:WD40 repeat protein
MIHLWDLMTGKLLQTLDVAFCGAVSQVLWLDDNRFICGCARGTLCVFLRDNESGFQVKRCQPII